MIIAQSCASGALENSPKFWKAVNWVKNKLLSSVPPQSALDDRFITEQEEMCATCNKHFAAAGHLFDRMSIKF